MHSTAAAAVNTGTPMYRLSRAISKVSEVWQEWHHGINGGISVSEFLERYERKGLPDEAERKYAQRRKKIITKIQEISVACGGIQNAINRVENFRIENGFSLYKLSQNINKFEL